MADTVTSKNIDLSSGDILCQYMIIYVNKMLISTKTNAATSKSALCGCIMQSDWCSGMHKYHISQICSRRNKAHIVFPVTAVLLSFALYTPSSNLDSDVGYYDF